MSAYLADAPRAFPFPKHLVSATLAHADSACVSPIVRGPGKKLLSEGDAQHDLHIAKARVVEGGMLALRLTPARD